MGLNLSRAKTRSSLRTLALATANSRAFSSEVGAGSREENASKQESRASVLIQSEPKLWGAVKGSLLMKFGGAAKRPETISRPRPRETALSRVDYTPSVPAFAAA
ncbi:hypothetical protein CWO90_23650 [Bradyrhizobium sp. Leo121]|nr:hypothetical protein CWO90_23650 [Bradyrhizobium sp. Leo121]